MFCPICGKHRNPVAGILAGRAHPECLRAQASERKRVEESDRRDIYGRLVRVVAAVCARKREDRNRIIRKIESGTFKNLTSQAKMILNEGEICCVIIKVCWSTLFYPRAAGRVMPGQTIRFDGLKEKDLGTLYITNKRVCFIGKGGAKALSLKKLLQCETRGDVLHLTAEGRASSSYFIIESPQALELTGVAIRKLAAMAKAGQKLIIE